MPEPGKVNQTSSPALKPINPGFFNNISWDKLAIEPMENVDFKEKYNNSDKLSHNIYADADEVAKAFMPEGDYAEGYITFVNYMPKEWFEKNRKTIEDNLAKDNPEYIYKADWGFDRYKIGLLDGELGPMHRM